MGGLTSSTIDDGENARQYEVAQSDLRKVARAIIPVADQTPPRPGSR
jgi:hypothetical protein